VSLKRRKWEKPFLWRTAKDGKVDLSEVLPVVNQLLLLGNEMAFQMMREMLAFNATSKEFCDSQNNWNRYLFDRATPSSNGEPAPASFESRPMSRRAVASRSSVTDKAVRQKPLKQAKRRRQKSASHYNRRPKL
jgi:hypothetical protein